MWKTPEKKGTLMKEDYESVQQAPKKEHKNVNLDEIPYVSEFSLDGADEPNISDYKL